MVETHRNLGWLTRQNDVGVGCKRVDWEGAKLVVHTLEGAVGLVDLGDVLQRQLEDELLGANEVGADEGILAADELGETVGQSTGSDAEVLPALSQSG